MDIRNVLLLNFRWAMYCLLGFVITACHYEITIERKSTAPTEAAILGDGTDTHKSEGAEKQCVVQTAQTFLGVYEKGSNRGSEVEAIQKEAGIPIGSPWCQALVLVCYNRCSIIHGMDGRARSACPEAKRIQEGEAGDVLCIAWSSSEIQHSGIIEKNNREHYVTIEGNTSDPEKAKPEGTYRKFRSKSLKHYVGRH